MAPTATRVTDLWVEAIRQRNRSTPHRMGVGFAACLIFSPLMGWETCFIWLVAYLVIQELERQAFKSVLKPGSGELHPLHSILGHILLTTNATLFGVISIPAWLLGGPMGGVAASVLLTAGMMNSVIMSAGSLRMFISTVLPQWLLLGMTPLFMFHFGAPSNVIIAAAVAICAYGVFCLTTRHHLFTARRAEFRARIEASRKQSEAEAVMRERSAFLAAVAHDLRTPISAILTGAAKIEEAETPSARRQNIALLTDAGNMMRDLLDDLLDHDRLEAGRMTIESHSFDARLLMSQTLRLWHAPVRAKGLKLRLEGAKTLPRYLSGDAMRLRQILNNLISNALKFTQEGSITIKVCSWPDEHGNHVVLIDVTDTGHGMTPEQMARLFIPYDQTAEGVAAQFGGSGLGLSISRNLIELMGGRMTVRSQPALGSTFTLSLTLPSGQAPTGAKTSASPKTAQGPFNEPIPLDHVVSSEDTALRVLVVDDHAINRRAIQLILQAFNCTISMAENGREALALSQSQTYDVIFMDVRMPELDGRETTRRLRASGGANATVPVIAVTADNANEDIEACLAAGMTSFVSKPLTPTSLLNAMKAALPDPTEEEAAQSVDYAAA